MIWIATLLPKPQRLLFHQSWHSCVSKGCHRDRTILQAGVWGTECAGGKPMSHGKMCIASRCFFANIRGIPQGYPWRSLKPLHSGCVAASPCPCAGRRNASTSVSSYVWPAFGLAGWAELWATDSPLLASLPRKLQSKYMCKQLARASIKAWKKFLLVKHFREKTFSASGTEPQSGIFQGKPIHI